MDRRSVRKYFRQRSKVFAGAYRNPNSVTELATCMMLEFIDQGTGIPAEEAHRVFQAFLQRKPRVCKKTGGLWGWTLSCQKNFGGAERARFV